MGVVKIYVLGVYNNYNIISFMEILHKHQILMFLLFVQNSCKLTPAGPKTVPTGGAGVAFPAGICNLIFLVIFFFATKNTSYNYFAFHVWFK